METVTKAGKQSKEKPFDFVLSDESVDRMGDVIRADGWDLKSFRKSPIALYQHDHNAPIGVWENVHVVGKQLRGTLKLAKQGTSDLIDTIRSLVEQRILKAVSVGFQPIEASPRKSGEGWDFKQASLHEVSLVSVPANPNALAIAKSMPGVNKDVLEKLFALPDSQSAQNLLTPNLDAARKRCQALGIDY